MMGELEKAVRGHRYLEDGEMFQSVGRAYFKKVRLEIFYGFLQTGMEMHRSERKGSITDSESV